jgi:hypothetical protein
LITPFASAVCIMSVTKQQVQPNLATDFQQSRLSPRPPRPLATLVPAADRVDAQMIRQEVTTPSAFPRPPAYAPNDGSGASLPVAVVARPVMRLKPDAKAVLDFLYPESIRVRSRHGETSCSFRSTVEQFGIPIDGLAR